MFFIKPFSYEYDLNEKYTKIKSFKIFDKGKILLENSPILLKYILYVYSHYKNEYCHFKNDLTEKVKGFEKLETTRSNCCRKMLNGYSCSKNYHIKTYTPEIGNETNFINFITRYKNCHKAYHEQKQVIDDLINSLYYPILLNAIEIFEQFVRRCIGYCHYCETKNIRFNPNHPFKFISTTLELNSFNKKIMYFFEDKKKTNDIDIELIEKFFKKVLIDNIINENFISQFENKNLHNLDIFYYNI